MAHIIPITPLIRTPCCPGSVGSSASDSTAPATPGSAAPQSGTHTIALRSQAQAFRRNVLTEALRGSHLLASRIQQARDLLDRCEPEPDKLLSPCGATIELICMVLRFDPAKVFAIFGDNYNLRHAPAPETAAPGQPEPVDSPPKGLDAVPEEECPSPSSSGS